MALLEIQAATILKEGQALFRPLNLRIAPGRPVTVMGPSGSGKSSLLAWITGVLAPPMEGRGRIILDGKPLDQVPPYLRRIGILFQDDLLFPHLSVGENLAFGLAQGQPRSRVAEALAAAGLLGLANRDPESLSGGERSRIALMRCLLSGPLALVLDEPFSKLDLARRQKMREFVFRHTQELPVLLVSHDPADTAPGGEIIELEPDPDRDRDF
jgi:putative thiamine transport system ATP-binding protein